VLQLIVKYTKHAREQMVFRGISENEVIECVKRGVKEIQEPDKILSYYRYYCVVYKKVNDTYYIITVKPR